MTDIRKGELILPNLAALGVIRSGNAGSADLDTVWHTPYPVITNYMQLMNLASLQSFGGGTRLQQGERIDGFITSAFRDDILNGNKTSAHLYALALDFLMRPADQFRVAVLAIERGLFSRVGFYPYDRFMHVDQAPDNWIRRYSKRHFWVRTQAGFKSSDDIAEIAAIMNTFRKD